jgi:hypothetical protein
MSRLAAKTEQLECGVGVASDEARYDALAFAAQAAAVGRDAAFICASLEHMSTPAREAFADKRFSAPK